MKFKRNSTWKFEGANVDISPMSYLPVMIDNIKEITKETF